MKIAIAIYLLIGAVSAGMRAAKEDKESAKWGSVASIAVHIWFGVWMLLNL